MAQNLPIVPSVPWYDLTTPLDNGDGTVTTYIFVIRWNVRDAAWYFTLRDQSNNEIVSGVKIVLGMYLGRRSAHTFFQQGALVAVDTAAVNGQGREAGFDDFGTRVVLRYYTAQEIVTGRAARAISSSAPSTNPMPWWTQS